MEKIFLFLYPEEDIFQAELERNYSFYQEQDPNNASLDALFLPRIIAAPTEAEKEEIRKEARRANAESFRPFYSEKLNACIDERYRKNGFEIVYARFSDQEISDVINLHPTDRVIKVGMSSTTHTTKLENGTFVYPDNDFILNQLFPVSHLRVAGFHMWDCVEKLAKRAYERGINVLVDEDLTEFFGARIFDEEFKIGEFPTYNPRKNGNFSFEMFLNARKDKPWLWQNY